MHSYRLCTFLLGPLDSLGNPEIRARALTSEVIYIESCLCSNFTELRSLPAALCSARRGGRSTLRGTFGSSRCAALAHLRGDTEGAFRSGWRFFAESPRLALCQDLVIDFLLASAQLRTALALGVTLTRGWHIPLPNHGRR